VFIVIDAAGRLMSEISSWLIPMKEENSSNCCFHVQKKNSRKHVSVSLFRNRETNVKPLSCMTRVEFRGGKLVSPETFTVLSVVSPC